MTTSIKAQIREMDAEELLDYRESICGSFPWVTDPEGLMTWQQVIWYINKQLTQLGIPDNN